MTEAHATIPVAWMAIEADVTGLVALRERQRRDFEREHGIRLSYMPFFVTVIAAALEKHRDLNASYTEEGLQLHPRIDLGIAVATDSGLLVPVVRGAEGKSVPELARELEDLGRRARERKLTVDEMRGATCTVDNTGAFGSLISQPIVPVGQVAIITTEAVRKEVRVRVDNALAVRSVMNLAISFDHRALDGAEAGRFMQDVRERLEAYRGDGDLD
jgi:2-oxoisovalerate dehydrogenase E2 component (dihydrolipoyl transacylase)